MSRSTIQLLRFHFSLFLLPVFLFALSESNEIDTTKAILVFFILHFLVYPSSNGYNSYMDRDESAIGGLAVPLQPTRQLFYTTVVMDFLACIISFFIDPLLSMGILLYILASRAYSYRGIRLKKYPVIGFLTVFIFQGALIFYISWHATTKGNISGFPWLPCLISSCLIGALYPLTQIYQHNEDRADGVTTLSMLLGKRESFIFSMLLFLSATFLLWLRFNNEGEMNNFFLFLLIMLPTVLFFLYWMWKVWMNESEANFRNSLRMNIISTLCTMVFFLTLIIRKH